MSSPIQVTKATPADLLWPLNEVEQKHAPEYLYVAGHSEWLADRPKVSIVGSRAASQEALRRAVKLARQLTERGVIVVSGLAKGIDKAVHMATLEAGGRTLAVIGTPLDITYPAEHRELQVLLSREHTVVSQFAPGTRVTRANFPRRNRTMALLVDASVIVEAGDSSGTLSQGWEALRLGRPLFIMQSVFEQPELTWPDDMLEYGAMVLTNTDDLLERLPSSAENPLAVFA